MIGNVFLLSIQISVFITTVYAFIPKSNINLHRVSRSNIYELTRSPISNDNVASRGKIVTKLNMAIPAKDVQIRIADLKWKVVPDIWESLASIIPDKSMLVDPVHGDKVDLTFKQCNDLITTGAAAMQKLGLPSDECVSIFAENSYKWFIADQAIMKAGCCNSVRGALAPIDELHYIYENSKSTAMIVESPNLLQKLFAKTDSANDTAAATSIVGNPRFVIVLFSRGMTGKEIALDAGIPSDVNVLSYEELLASAVKEEFKPVPKDPKSPATLVYTSGTTAKPKGVVLRHSNLMYQIENNSFNKVNGRKFDPWVSDVFLSILPCWHIFERTAEYWCLARGSQMVYSNLRNFKSDLMFASAIGAVFMWPIFKVADLLIWSKIRQNLGGRLKVMVSGGSALPLHIESFFDMAGLRIVAGYGLTETSPTLLNRVVERNVLGSVGVPPQGTEIKIVQADSRVEVPVGQVGVLLARGPGVMAGYMDNAQATAKAIDREGFFDTGDLGRINPATGDIIITGRAKDTIVLSNGENVEPQPIEDAIIGTSALVDQAMIVGQDQNFLSAFVVVNPAELAKRGLLSESKGKELDDALGAAPMTAGPAGDVEYLRAEAIELNSNAALKEAILADLEPVFLRLRPWERVQSVTLFLEPFSVPNGLLTQTLKLKRPEITAKYKEIIDQTYSNSRRASK